MKRHAKPEMTITEFARLGGYARKASMSAAQRREQARKAGLASAAKRARAKAAA